jgi:broad specificity phosphatase PhoE
LLTETGKSQCKELREKFPFHGDVELILASPLRRTIQTAAYVFAPELEKRQIPIILVPNAQEISPFACDLGSDAGVVKSEAPTLIADASPSWDAVNLDTTLVNESWNSKVRSFVGLSPSICAYSELFLQKEIYAPTLSAVRRRAAELRKWIYNRPEKHLALVSHGGFLHYLTEDWTGYDIARGIITPLIGVNRINVTDAGSS